jgi:hypothetical protein
LSQKVNRLIIFRARSKGKTVFPVTIALTETQIDWLKKQPNASALIRKLIDDLMMASRDIEEKLHVISLKNQLEALQKERHKISSERWNYVFRNFDERREENRWQTTERKDEYKGVYIVWADEKNLIPKPLDTKEGKIGMKILKGYDDAIEAVDKKIIEVENKILEGE